MNTRDALRLDTAKTAAAITAGAIAAFQERKRRDSGAGEAGRPRRVA